MSNKERIKELKDVLEGRKTILSLAKDLMPPRVLHVYQEGSVYKVDSRDDLLSEEQYQAWLEAGKGERTDHTYSSLGELCGQ